MSLPFEIPPVPDEFARGSVEVGHCEHDRECDRDGLGVLSGGLNWFVAQILMEPCES